MAKLKVESFLDLVRRSGLVERDQLNRVLLELKEEAEGKPIPDTEFVADRLVEAGLITRWQADRLLEGRHKGFFLGKYKLLGPSGHRRHEQRLSGRARADAAPRGDQGAAQEPRRTTPPIWPASTARPRPPPRWTTATSSGPTTSTTTATSTTW